ncbi:MAG: DNA internalization-related competence protein ComEC/Rec2, partial [Ignavibacteriales bacterium]|nr:DNA internalization-related competence protein ComEC/Rec2 [Ignavibacteriales bacterium]
MLWGLLASFWLAALVLAIKSPGSAVGSVFLHFSVLLLAATWTSVRESELAPGSFASGSSDSPMYFRAILEEAPAKQGTSLRLVVVCDSILIGGQWKEGARFLATMPWKRAKFAQLLMAGQSVELWGTLAGFPRPRNPGEFDYGRYLKLKDIRGIVRIDSLERFPSPAGGTARSWFAAVRSQLGSVLEKHHGPVQAGFLRGVVFGDRKDISPELKESFMNTGTIHILAVSGSNVALIALMLYLVLGLFRLSKRWVVALTLVGLLMYMMITGAESSIVRATIMGCVIVVGTAMERRTDIFNSISVAAMVVLLIDPLQVFDVGFQLSFAAVLSIVLLYPRLEALIHAIPESFEEFKILEPVWKVFAVSAAAQLGTLPFTAYYFERVSLVAFAANIIVVPLVGLNLILASMTIAVDALSGWLAAVYAGLNEFLVDVLLGFVRFAADVPGATVETYGFGFLAAFLYYTVLFVAFSTAHPRRVKVGAGVCGALLCIMIFRDAIGHNTNLRLTMLDVGQGDALLVEFPNRTRMLVDAGPKTFGNDAGDRIVVPFLARHGIERLDGVVLSHAHGDHIGGLAAVMEAVEVGVIYEPDTMIASALHRRLREIADQRRIPIVRAAAGANISPDYRVRVYAVHPPPGHSSVVDLNNGSLVVKLVYGRTTALLTGDAELEAEETMR